MGCGGWRLEAMDLDAMRESKQQMRATHLDGLGIDLQSLFFVNKEILHDIALVALELNHSSGLLIIDNSAVAGELLLDDFEDLLEVELGRNSFNSGQGLTTIALYTRLDDVSGMQW